MKSNKKTVVYARTSSKKQSYKLQLDAAKAYLKGIPDENIVYIVDHGVPVSSNLNGLQQLLDLISQDQVDTLIVYSRDRLTRNEDEYQAILKLIYAHEVKVVDTAKGTLPFNQNQQIEDFYLRVINMEKASMSNRIKAGLTRKKA